MYFVRVYMLYITVFQRLVDGPVALNIPRSNPNAVVDVVYVCMCMCVCVCVCVRVCVRACAL